MQGPGIALLAGILFCALVGTAHASTPLTTVDSVDLTRYAGTWYEIARYPNRFQKNCQSDTTANYTLLGGGKVQVVNSCRQADGSLTTAHGRAKVVDTKSNSKLKVTFFWPFYGDYWIVGLAPDYSYAIVGEPDRKYLWVLSRTPKMTEQAYAAVLDKIRAAGYDPSKLMTTSQSGHR